MTRVLAVLLGVGLSTVLVSATGHSQTLEGLKANFEADIQALNTRSPDAFVASAHDEVVFFGILSPFPLDGKDEFRSMMKDYLSDKELVTLAVQNPGFYLSGQTGVAWGHYALTHKAKGRPQEHAFGRYTFTYAQADAKWVLVALHFSPLQSLYYLDFGM